MLLLNYFKDFSEQQQSKGAKGIWERYGWLECCGWLECFGWLGCHCMSAALECLDWKPLILGKLFPNSEINDIALVNINVINRPDEAWRFYRHLRHRLIKLIGPSVILFLQIIKTS